MSQLVREQMSFANILIHSLPRVKSNLYWIVGIDIINQAKSHRRFLPGVGAENTVPDDQQITIIAVNVFWIGSMMHSVSRGRIENTVKPSKTTYHLSVTHHPPKR